MARKIKQVDGKLVVQELVTQEEEPMAVDPTQPATKKPHTFLNVSVDRSEGLASLLFRAGKTGGTISASRLGADGMTRFALRRLEKAFPQLGTALDAFPFLRNILYSITPVAILIGSYYRWLPTSDANQDKMGEWALTATVGHSAKFFDKLGDDFFDALVQAGENEVEKFKKNPLGDEDKE